MELLSYLAAGCGETRHQWEQEMEDVVRKRVI